MQPCQRRTHLRTRVAQANRLQAAIRGVWMLGVAISRIGQFVGRGIEMANRYWTSSQGFELTLSDEDAQKGYHPGSCDSDIESLLKLPYIAEQLEKWEPEAVRNELREYGAWEEGDLNDDEANKGRMLWLACGDLGDME
jgi:hypothetical protein